MLKSVLAIAQVVKTEIAEIVHAKIVLVQVVIVKSLQVFTRTKKDYLLHNFFVLIFLLLSINIYCQNSSYATGIIIDSVEVLNSKETYALYLPKKFDKNKLSSIVFIFDPVARGKIGIQPFIESAEKYNHILICSNNSKNGSLEINFNITNRLFNVVFETFSIDENLIYTAGFSGGSRLATAVAVLTKQVQGIIACGAGFSPNNAHIPISKENFSYVGLVGDMDMNYQEMLKVKDWLDRFKITNEIFTYEDEHRWPPSAQIVKAFSWLELQAYTKNIKPKNVILINEYYHSTYKTAIKLENKNQLLPAVWEYERIIRNFSRYYKLDSIKSKINQLKEGIAYITESKKRKEIEIDEAKIRKKFVERFSNEIDNIPKNYKWWHKELKKFNDKNQEFNDPDYDRMGKRINYALYAMAIETSYSQLRKNNITKALYCHHLVAIMIPEQSFPYFLIAKDYALLNNEDKFIEYLNLSVSKGFIDKNQILNTKEFEKYRNSEKMILLLNSLKE